jgi:molybdopterin converting factor small subunit
VEEDTKSVQKLNKQLTQETKQEAEMKIKFEAAIKELEQTLAKEKSVANAKLAEANLGFQNKFEQFHKEAETKLMTY